MIERFKFLLFLGFHLLCSSLTRSHGESSTCLMVYKEGGAPAVFQSPKCPRWALSTEGFRWRMENCEYAMLQGRRKHHEDRAFCALDLRIPFPGRTGIKDVKVGMIAVFDGHNGAEASEMASKLLLEYFFLHVYFLLDGIYSVALKKSTGKLLHKGDLDVVFQVFNPEEAHNHDLDLGRSKWMLPEIFDGSFHLEILKESLLRAIHDIDATFSKEAFRKNLDSGSTATVVLIVDGQILVANVGDSKALLCSEKFQSPQEVKGTLLKLYRQRRRNGGISLVNDNGNLKLAGSSGGLTHFFVKELTRDHHPDRDDERARVEAAGGSVVDWAGVARVNGELAVSRAIGDVSFKSYGVISAPEVTGWLPLTANDSYLVAASDGVFEKLTTQDICDLLWDVHTEGDEKSKLFSSCMYSLADCIVNTAFEKGSMDNMAAVVVPLRPSVYSGTLLKERYDGEGSISASVSRLQKFSYTKSANVITSGLVPIEYASQVMANFNRLLVEGAHGRFGFFYLYKNLNENMDYMFGAQNDDWEDEVYDRPQALPGALGHHHSGPLNFYSDQNSCLHFGVDIEGDKGQCVNPEGFARFLALLESIPFPDSGSNSSGLFGYDTHASRYVLKRRFGRGSYGEVWLAFHWNRSQDGDVLNLIHPNKTCSVNNFHLDVNGNNTSSQTNSSSHHCHTGPDDADFFILKRIMVERGTAVYLSGLREKYFGEVFLNASVSLGGLLSEGLSYSFSKEAQYDNYKLLEANKAIENEIGDMWNQETISPGSFRTHSAVFEEGLKHIARYVESFESRSKEIWLVFRNEGVSLSKLMYTTEETDKEKDEQVNNVQVLHPSTWWHWLRTTESGKEEMRNLIWQLLMALKSCHDRNITHRDIKPENMVICFEDENTGRCSKGSSIGDKRYNTKMRIIDFGSAIDEFTIKHLYGSNGPSRSEQTYEYTPPEAFLNSTWFEGLTSKNLKYDMWSVGVVMLELIIGSPHVFQLNSRTRALLDQHLEGWSEATKELAYKFRSFMEMCILIPGSSTKCHRSRDMKDCNGVWPASWKCSEESFSNQVKSRDPLKLGFPNIWALRLVRQLLRWDPEDRLSVDEALKHPYFQTTPQT